MRPLSLALLLGCGSGETDSHHYAEALDENDVDRAISHCLAIEDLELSEECIVGVVRNHSQGDYACAQLKDPRWAGECWFSVAEAQAPDRWSALESCARAGPYLQECLYHLWTAELSQLLEYATDIAQVIPEGREIVDFWAGADHLLENPRTQLWNDFWFFAIRHHGPANMEWCEDLEPALTSDCHHGLKSGVQRSLVDFLEDPSTPPGEANRACRSGTFDPSILAPIALNQAELVTAADQTIERACALARGESIQRWNPIFRELNP